MPNSVLYGYIQQRDLFDLRLSQINVRTVTSALDQAIAEHNRQLNALMGLFASRTTEYKVRFRSPTLARLQALDEHGRALPIKFAGQYDTAFPLHDAGTAWGANWRTRAKMTLDEFSEAVDTMFTADTFWMRDHVLAALFNNAGWTFQDPEHGSLSIVGLANGDTVQYRIFPGAETGATDTHYLAQAAAIDNSNDPFPAIYDELTEHPENSGEVVALIPTNLKAAVQGLSGFMVDSDPNIRAAANERELVGSLGVQVPGQVIGYHDAGVWIAEWKSMPASYIIATTTGGERPLRMREEPEPELQGFGPVAVREDHPYWERQYVRIAGFGGWNRVNALVYRIGNASYAVPTGYTSPMP